MNKFVTVLGVAAVATLAGCKDPNYKPYSTYSQGEVKDVGEAPKGTAIVSTPVDVTPIAPVTPSCKCPPGTKHASPCTCGAPDCQCIVEVKPLPPPPPSEPEYTTYIVQNGDYLAKISKKYNISISSIKKLNRMSNDTIRVGQKLKLPGKVAVGVQTAPVKAEAAKKAVVRGTAEYKGETKEYVVKSGDTLGAIAYSNGCNIRQLKKLNALTSDSLKVGQKLKVPAAGKVATEKKPAVAADVKSVTKPEEKTSAEETKPVETPESLPVTTPAPETTPTVVTPSETTAPAVPVEPQTSTYTVVEGDDMTGVSIRFGVPTAVIRELNNLPEDAQLTVGQKIKLPADAQQ